MTRAGTITLALFALVSAASANPTTHERINVAVRISPSTDGVVARYEITRPVAQMFLEYGSTQAGKGERSVTTPGISYESGQIRGAGGRLFDKFDLVARARNELSGPYYPCVMKIGPLGRVIYASCFAAHQDEFRTTIAFAPPRGAVVMGLPDGVARLAIDRTYFGSQAGPRYVFIGPSVYVHRKRGADYVVGPEAPAWITPQVKKIAERILPFYEGATGVALGRKPLFLVTAEPGDEASMAFQADVTDGPNVALRFFSDGWVKPSAWSTGALDHSIPHEIAHFWNSHHFRSLRSDRAPWLHEGGAEYWARIAQRRLDLAGDKDPTTALNQCIDLLGVDGLKPTHGQIDYACGETLQWIADLGEQTHGRDVFALWREMFARAEANGGYYSAEMFRSLAERSSPAVADAFRLIFEPGDPVRWQNLPQLLAPLDVKIESARFPADRMRNRIIMHLLKQTCGRGRSYGKRSFDDHFVLDSEGCGPLSGNPEVDTINGVKLFTDAATAYEAVTTACASGATITLSRTGKPERRSMICTVPLPPLPRAFRLGS